MSALVQNNSALLYSTRSSWKVAKQSPQNKSTKSRKGPKARTWTEEEERYLLQSRMQRLPYKRIAARLQKSELACRLHYHQLTVVKARSSVETDTSVEGDDDHYLKPFLQVSASSPTSPELLPRISLTPSPRLGGQNLPGVSAMLDGAFHRRSISAPERVRSQSVAPIASQQTSTSGLFGIIPAPQLLNPFDSIRTSPLLSRELPPPMVNNSNHSTPYLDRHTPTITNSTMSTPYLGRTSPMVICSEYTSPYLDRTPPTTHHGGPVRPQSHRSFTAPSWHSPNLSKLPPHNDLELSSDRTSVQALLNHERSTISHH